MNHPRIRTLLGGRRPRYADVAATLALLFAMGGTAYAATSLGPNTVGTVQLKDNAVTNPKIDTHAVSTGKLSAEAVTITKLADDSVDSTKLQDLAVTNAKLGDGSVTSTKLGDGSVTNFKLGSGVVTHSKLGPDSIDGSNVAANSLGLADLVGADVNGHISFSLGANHCGDLSLGVSGSQLGQIVVFSFAGNVAVPSSVVFGGSKVTSAGHITVRACNVSGSAMSVSNLGIHIATFG
jgi:hypothetical protein